MKASKIFTPVTITTAISSVIVGCFCGLFLAQAEANITKESELQASITHQQNSVLSKAEKDTKIFNKALHYADLKTCENISDEENKISCKNSIFSEMAIREQKIEICDEITNEDIKKNCQNLVIERQAYENSDKKICEKIENPTAKTRCKENIDAEKFYKLDPEAKNSLTECQSLEENFKKICIEKIAQHAEEEKFFTILASKNIKKCDELSILTLKNNCQDILWSELAEEKIEKKFCENIQNSDKKSACLEKITKISDEKISQKAIQTKNIPLCGEITDKNLTKKCNDIIILELVQESKNLSLCEFLQMPEHKNICEQIIDF